MPVVGMNDTLTCRNQGMRRIVGAMLPCWLTQRFKFIMYITPASTPRSSISARVRCGDGHRSRTSAPFATMPLRLKNTPESKTCFDGSSCEGMSSSARRHRGDNASRLVCVLDGDIGDSPIYNRVLRTVACSPSCSLTVVWKLQTKHCT
jgi:hypothetical protein